MEHGIYMCLSSSVGIYIASVGIYIATALYIVSVGRASHLECVRRGFESHLSAAFSLEKFVSGLVLCCVVLLCLSLF